MPAEKPQIAAKITGPGPGHYCLPPTVGRRGHDPSRRSHPAYSFGAKWKEPYLTPAPGAYYAEKVKPTCTNEKRAPTYHIGARTQHRRTDTVPAPNSYTLPNEIGPSVPHKSKAPCFSFRQNSTLYSSSYDYWKTPGPASYNSGADEKKAMFSFGERTQGPKSKMNVPGPGTYNPKQVNKKSTPRFSMGVRHSEHVMPLVTMADIDI